MARLFPRTSKKGKLLIFLAALTCAGIWTTLQIRSARSMADVLKMAEKTKTVCVGRLLIDVPGDAQVKLFGDRLDGFKIESVVESEDTFLQREAARERQIGESTNHDGVAHKKGMVKARDLRVPAMRGRILIYGRTRSYAIKNGIRVDDEWVSIEAHAHLQGVSFSLAIDYADVRDADAAEGILAQLRLRQQDAIPAAPGFCTERAVFVEPLPPHKTEHAAMHIGFVDHPDIALAFVSLPGGGENAQGLLMRHAEMDAMADADELLRVTRLRLGPRDINGLRGEEVLERVREFNLATTYGFIWEAPGVNGNPLQPFLSLELHGGISPRPGARPVDSNLHQEAVLALWSRISSSIRLQSPPPPAISTAQR